MILMQNMIFVMILQLPPPKIGLRTVHSSVPGPVLGGGSCKIITKIIFCIKIIKNPDLGVLEMLFTLCIYRTKLKG